MVGSTVSHYRILSSLGAGGMGVVYLAEDTLLHRNVALKFLNDTSAPSDGRERLLREARAESTLDHPNIATVYEVGEWEGQLFIAMAYYSGETLKQRLERGPMAIGEAIAIAAHIARGVEAAHAAGIVHRDLKPANIIITGNNQVKILDFGLAKALSKAETETQLSITASGTTVGTVAYMAPEQALGQDLDERADVWAFGAVLFEMFAGRRPFEAPNAAALLFAVVSDDVPPVATFRPDVPAPLQQLIAAALVKDREERTIAIAEIASILEAHRDHRTVSGVALPVARRISRTSVVLLLVVIAVAIAGAGWFLKRKADERWLRTTAIPEIRRDLSDGNFVKAFERALSARALAPADAELTSLWKEITRTISITTDPLGADVSIAGYGIAATNWIPLGKTPLTNVALPRNVARLRFAKPDTRPPKTCCPASRCRPSERPWSTNDPRQSEW
jgi:eukaryotic-like serine/threonine-protein kinase